MINQLHIKNKIKGAHFFVVGGTMRRNAPSYVKRPADDELLMQVLAGQFCYVLTSRQMGKSSLMVRTAQRLKAQQVKSVILDLTEMGTVTVDQWYLGLLTRIAQKLKLSVKPEAWWPAHASLSIVQRFSEYLLQVALAECQEKIVIFIDEIDSTIRFDFSDDFFAAIRAMYNARAHNSTFERLTFVLLGTASPSDLMKDRTRTPFNIGYRISLQEFSLTDAALLQTALEQIYPTYGQLIFKRIYDWTSGHPYLTQKLCLLAANEEHEEWATSDVDQLVQQLFFSSQRIKETNLQFVQDRILTHKEAQKQLNIYYQVYNGIDVPDDQQSPLQNNLKLSGLVKEQDGYLQIRNEIYRTVFNQNWIEEKWIFIRTARKRQPSSLPPSLIATSNNGQPASHDLATMIGKNGAQIVSHSRNRSQIRNNSLSESELAQNLRAWFDVQGYTFEDYHKEGDAYFEWIINIPTRRRVDRILVRGVEGEADMMDLNALQQRVLRMGADEGWLIAPRRVAQAVRQVAKERAYRDLYCYTFDEFLDEEIDFSHYLEWLEEEVKQQGIDRLYVSHGCTKYEYDFASSKTYNSQYDSLDEYIGQWLDDPTKEHISILGEFGTGKTWFSLHYAWILLQAYRQAQKLGRKRPRLPLLIPLRDYAKEIDVDSLFLKFVFRKHNITGLRNYAAFEQLNRMGKLLLIFDGFDEMADRVDRDKMVKNFWELARAVVPGAKAILTSRTEHFPARQESLQLFNANLLPPSDLLPGESPKFEILHLNKFTDEQIHEVLSLHATPETVARILNHPDLKDLASRPVMISLILQALPQIQADKEVDLARVYLYAVTHQLEKINTGRSFTSTADKLYFLCELSWQMLSSDQMSLNYRDFPDRLRQLFGIQAQKDLDYWAYDMRGQTMLIRNEHGDYRPAHRSLLEFFVAYKFCAELGILADDFFVLARSQSHIDVNKPTQDYSWSEYFQSQANQDDQVVPIPALSDFVAESTDKLKASILGKTRTKAVLDLMEKMIDPIKLQASQKLIQQLKLERCHKCFGELVETGRLGRASINLRNEKFFYVSEIYHSLEKHPVISYELQFKHFLSSHEPTLKTDKYEFQCLKCKWIGVKVIHIKRPDCII